MRTIRIDAKTVILIQDDKEPEETKIKFLEKLNESREKRMRSRIPYLID